MVLSRRGYAAETYTILAEKETYGGSRIIKFLSSRETVPPIRSQMEIEKRNRKYKQVPSEDDRMVEWYSPPSS